MDTISGDLLQLAVEGRFDVVLHGCNCHCTMGAGIAKQIKDRFPAAYLADLETKPGDVSKLGTFTSAEIKSSSAYFTIVNCYTQYNWKGRGIKADYEAIRSCFKAVRTKFSGMRIGYPKIGAGLAGGDWERIAVVIEEEMEGEDHTLVVYEKA